MALAARQGDRWAGKMVVYVGDNSNVNGWLTTRRSGNRYVRFLLRLLLRMEGQHRFQTIAGYIRTEHNAFADDLTRLPLPETTRMLTRAGMAQVDLLGEWVTRMERGWERRALT